MACRYAAKDSFSTLIEFFAASQQDMTKVREADAEPNRFYLEAIIADL